MGIATRVDPTPTLIFKQSLRFAFAITKLAKSKKKANEPATHLISRSFFFQISALSHYFRIFRVFFSPAASDMVVIHGVSVTPRFTIPSRPLNTSFNANSSLSFFLKKHILSRTPLFLLSPFPLLLCFLTPLLIS